MATPDHSLAPGGHKKKQVMRSVKAGLCFPVGSIGRYLKEGRYSQRIGLGAPVYLIAILEYLTTEVLELVGQAGKDSKKTCIIPKHVMLAVMRYEELSMLLASITITHDGMLTNIHLLLLDKSRMTDVTKSPAADAAKSP